MPSKPPTHKPAHWKPREQREHERRKAIDEQRPGSAARGYDAAWRKLRAVFLRQHPDCATPRCGAMATDVDHIVSIRDRPDLRLDWGNLRSLCAPCHARRTARDQGFARPRRPG